MDEKNNELKEEMEKPSARMRAPMIRKSEEAGPAEAVPETETGLEVGKTLSGGVRRPAFDLSVPSGIEDHEGEEKEDEADGNGAPDQADPPPEGGVRRPAFNLSVPSGIEDPQEEYEEIIRQFEHDPVTEEGEENENQAPDREVPPEEGKEDGDGEEDREDQAAPVGKFKTVLKSRALSRILLGLSLVFFVAGIYFFVKPAIIHKNQEKVGKELLNLLENREPGNTGEVTLEVRVKDVYMPGSYDDGFDLILPPGATEPAAPETRPGSGTRPSTIVIKSDTVMIIPSINFESAMAPDVRESTLWVLPGHFPPSAQPGELGVAAYFGHRMIKKGLHFNRLNEIKVGDRIVIKRLGETYHYIVDDYRIVEPSEVGKYVYESTDTSRILLVTCDPVIAPRSTKQRILVGAYLEGGLPAP